MEFQFHPASRRGSVRAVALGDRGERAALAAAAVAAAFSVSLWVTVPTVARRALRAEGSEALARSSAAVAQERRDLETRVAGMRERALDLGDLVGRIAFLYGVTPAGWPTSLNPESGVLAGRDPDSVVSGLLRYGAGLEQALKLVAAREAVLGSLTEQTPSILPLISDLVEPASRFGPRVSPWTGSEEFFAGMDLAAPAGASVVAPASGTVVFAGRIPPATNARLWRFGNLVVVSHGAAGVTVYGHLNRVDVRRGDRVRRGQRLGSVGTTGWAMFPAVHYEYWRRGEDGLSPTDPRFAMLDLRLTEHDVSLERMRATSAPATVQPPPGAE
ncbi:MAG TPA: M23 family metallopeptidase [Thermoanaerobaculia bacterium]|nr:M23 family metallopeptidase [Thermoanaerobaculia bacterium]